MSEPGSEIQFGGVNIHRARLQNLLVEATKEAGIVIELNARVVQIGETGSSPVVVIKDGRIREADLSVGADGLSFHANSALRFKANK
jgi:2-polyprenyl-6-methoxyphenol hydroxylase-like FAD-dependent oxidoreductase